MVSIWLVTLLWLVGLELGCRVASVAMDCGPWPVRISIVLEATDSTLAQPQWQAIALLLGQCNVTVK